MKNTTYGSAFSSAGEGAEFARLTEKAVELSLAFGGVAVQTTMRGGQAIYACAPKRETECWQSVLPARHEI